MPEQIRKAWNRGAIPFYVALCVVLSMACGYSICAAQNLQAAIEMTGIHSKERASMRRAHKAEVRALTDRNIYLTQQIADLARTSSNATKAALEKGEK